MPTFRLILDDVFHIKTPGKNVFRFVYIQKALGDTLRFTQSQRLISTAKVSWTLFCGFLLTFVWVVVIDLKTVYTISWRLSHKFRVWIRATKTKPIQSEAQANGKSQTTCFAFSFVYFSRNFFSSSYFSDSKEIWEASKKKSRTHFYTIEGVSGRESVREWENTVARSYLHFTVHNDTSAFVKCHPSNNSSRVNSLISHRVRKKAFFYLQSLLCYT